jgi:hypothetical protein
MGVEATTSSSLTATFLGCSSKSYLKDVNEED